MKAFNGLNSTFKRIGFTLKQHSPEIMVVAGVVGVVTSGVMACRATVKALPVIEESKRKLNTLREAIESPESLSEEVTVQDCKDDSVKVMAHTTIDLAKLYLPSIAVGVVSITAILAGHNITRKRNVALAAAYTAVDTAFKDYRGRVIERFGEELDRELKFDIKTKEIEETVVNEDGSETTVTKTVEVAEAYLDSDYAKFFDASCRNWTKNAEMNLLFLKRCQAMANDKLKADKYLYLNDVYDMLGIDKTEAGKVVGWVYDEENPIGDNFVDFGIYNLYKERNRAFVNGYEPVILLDFNVDGNLGVLLRRNRSVKQLSER